MSVTPLLEDPILQDYLQPVVTSVDSGIIWIFRMNFSVFLILHLIGSSCNESMLLDNC